MASRRAQARAATPVVKKKLESGIKVGVHIAACLEREFKKDDEGDEIMPDYPGKRSLGYAYGVSKLHVDQYGNVIASAGCQANVFVCTAKEVPAFLEFFQKLGTNDALLSPSAKR